MGRGRKPIHQTVEDRERAIKESKMKYYKKNKAEILKKNKERYHKNKGWDEDHALDMVMNDMVSDWDVTLNDGLNDLDDGGVTFEAFDDDTSSDYEGIIT